MAQTGVQILTGLLLTLPFTDRFEELDDVQRTVYLAILCGSVLATGMLIAPVAFHRVLFRRGERKWIVSATNRFAVSGLLTLAATTSGVVWLVFDVVTNRVASGVAGAIAITFLGLVWAVLPMVRARRD